MNILAIETSCDETAVSILQAEGTLSDLHLTSRADITLSQTETHAAYGGVFPSLAKREHAINITPLLTRVLSDAGMYTKGTDSYAHLTETYETLFSHEEGLASRIQGFLEDTERPDIDAIAVTYGPGLEPALWVGINVAKALSLAWEIPLIPVNHLEGHLASVLIDPEKNQSVPPPEHPTAALIISGGHTELISFDTWGSYTHLGGTVDDAVGEAFDKVARMLELPYPGGPPLSALAADTRAKGAENPFSFPRPMLGSTTFDLSFSGLKTAVLYTLKELKEIDQETRGSIAEAFEDAAAEVLVAKAERVCEVTEARSLIVCGGVSANALIRERFRDMTRKRGVGLFIPPPSLSTDNALMIAIAGYITSLHSPSCILRTPDDILSLKAAGNAPLNSS